MALYKPSLLVYREGMAIERVMVNLRVDAEMIQAVDKLAEAMSGVGDVTFTRSDIIRMALRIGAGELAKQNARRSKEEKRP